jgi:hypothetical protein
MLRPSREEVFEFKADQSSLRGDAQTSTRQLRKDYGDGGRRVRYEDVSAGSRNGHASGVRSPDYFILSNVFWRISTSVAPPKFSLVVSIHFFSKEFFVGRSF